MRRDDTHVAWIESGMVCYGRVDQHKRDVEEVRRRDALLDATALWTGNGNWSRRSKQRMKLSFGTK